MKTIHIIVAFYLLHCEAFGQGNIYIISPGGGPVVLSDNPWPFYVINQTVRYQEVHRSSDFRDYGVYDTGAWITRLYFVGAAVQVDNVEIRMSTTQTAGPDSMSPVFANNVGPNESVVYSGPITTWSAPRPPDYPDGGSFGPSLVLQKPFFYRPADGNLLIDVRNYHPMQWQGFDFTMLFINRINDGTGNALAFDVNATSAEYITTEGLLIRFQLNSIPEPSVYALMFIGLFPLWIIHRHRSKTA